jgi:hypothetical protein
LKKHPELVVKPGFKCPCFNKEVSEKQKEFEELDHKENAILHKTPLEWKFVSLKLIPGLLCS